MHDIYLVTPPDTLYNKNYNILLICPSDHLKTELQNTLKVSNKQFNIFLYELPNESQDINWLLAQHRLCDTVLIDIDNVSQHVRDMISYIISFTNTYWITQGENILFNKLSCNRFYHCDEISALTEDTSEIL